MENYGKNQKYKTMSTKNQILGSGVGYV